MTDEAAGHSAVSRTLMVLGAFTHERPDATARALAEWTGIPESSLFRLLRPLVKAGLVARDAATGRYSPGLKTIELGDIAARQLRLVEVVQPVLDDLQRATEETANFSVYRGTSRVCVAKADSALHLRDVINVGESYPLWLGAASKAIAAFLPEPEQQQIARQGFPDGALQHEYLASLAAVHSLGLAVTEGERVPGVRAVGAPVFGRDGSVLGSVTISGPSFHMSADPSKYAEVVRMAARRLSEALN